MQKPDRRMLVLSGSLSLSSLSPSVSLPSCNPKCITGGTLFCDVGFWSLAPKGPQIEVLTQLKISIWLIKAFIFNASKLFNSKHYPYDNDDMSLDKLLMKFTILKVKNALCKVELLEFIETSRCECDNKWWNPASPHAGWGKLKSAQFFWMAQSMKSGATGFVGVGPEPAACGPEPALTSASHGPLFW